MRPVLLLVFAVALGDAAYLHNASQPLLPYLLLALALLAVAAATFVPLPDRAVSLFEPLFLAAIALQSAQLIIARPQWAMKDGAEVFAVISVVVIGCAMAAALRVKLIPAAMLLLALYVVYKTPNPWIDVHQMHVESFKDLLAGRDPYGQTRENIYAAYPGLRFYSPEVLLDGGRRINVGFPYPPLQLLLTLPGYLLTGDYRYVQALALPLSAALMIAAGRTRLALAASALLLLTPTVFYVVEGSWTEPMVVLMLSIALFCAVRAPRHLWWALGLLFSIKQYTVALLLILPLLRVDRRTVLKALGAAALINLPFFLWNPGGFLRDLLFFEALQPIRLDSLSFLTRALAAGADWPLWIGFALLALLLGLALWRAPRTVSGFAAATALAYCAFFAFAKQAFPNYYLFPLAAGCWALATTADSAQTVNQGT
jgi:hypothetical protein